MSEILKNLEDNQLIPELKLDEHLPVEITETMATIALEGTVEEQKQGVDSFSFDCEQVKQNPDFIGINFDSSLIVDGRVDWSAEKILSQLKGQDISAEMIEENLLINRNKVEAFKRYVDSYNGKLKHARVNPFGASSPSSPAQAIEQNYNGEYSVNISPSFFEQMHYLADHCEDITLVVSFFDKQRLEEETRSDAPETPDEIDKYVAICNRLIEELGDNISLELGNETNISHKTGGEFAGDGRLQFASHVDSGEYAKFYFEVAKQVKSKYPDAKLSIAGLACYDESYLHDVLYSIEQLRVDNGIEVKLIDTISYHPYGDSPEVGAWTVRDGKLIDTNLSFNEQLSSMQRLAELHGVNLNIGEINFMNNDPEQRDKLKQSLKNIIQKKVVTMIWPTKSMPSVT